MGTTRKTRPQPFRLSLPATSANLGPAFDAAALAFNLRLDIAANLAEEFTVSARGRDTEVCGKIEDHLILETYKDVLRSVGKPFHSLALRINNEIPVGKGCGSSAAARLAGIALANHFGCLNWNDTRIVAEAAQREHHPDNAAACWFGGVAVAQLSSDGKLITARIKPKRSWSLLLAVPEQPLSTEKARAVLPQAYSRSDAVANIQAAALLVSAFVQGKDDLLTHALNDRIHQPYRESLCPLLTPLKLLAGKSGILGAVLSGAGPSVLMFLAEGAGMRAVQSLVARTLRKHGLRPELIVTRITPDGARR